MKQELGYLSSYYKQCDSKSTIIKIAASIITASWNVYTVLYKKGGSTFVTVTLENLDDSSFYMSRTGFI